MSNKGSYLIVGQDGFVGSALADLLCGAGENVIGTTRREKTKGSLFLDLAADPSKWELPEGISVAFICAGITKIETCHSDPKGSGLVNTERIPYLAKELAKKGAFVVYLSTNQVFDGTKPYRLPDEPLCPVTGYGSQKAEAEKKIGALKENASIVRFSKIVGPGYALIKKWAEMLRNGQTIQPFSDLYMAPVPLSCAVCVLRLVADTRTSGIMQVSGEKDITYEEAALKIASLLKADPKLVKPVKASVAGLETDMIPRHTTMNMDRLRSVFGIEPPDVWCTIGQILK